MNSAAVGFQCPECVSEGRRTQRQVRSPFGGTRAGALGRVTLTLIAINVLVMVAAIVSSGGGGIAGGGFGGLLGGTTPLHFWGSIIPGPVDYVNEAGRIVYSSDGVAGGEYYRLVTSMFIHYGVLHLLMNMWALWVIGRNLEAALGPIRFLALYLLSGLGGSVAVLLFAGPSSLTAGASGAIFGLFIAFFLVLRRLGRDTSQIIPLIVLNVLISFVPGISLQGHLGGLVTGGVVAAALVYAPPRNRTAVQTAGLVGVLVVLLFLIVAGVARYQL